MAKSKAIVVIPTLDEARYIADVVQGFLKDEMAPAIWVIDGGSTDGTVEIVEGLAAQHARISLFHNPRRSQASALNMASGFAAREGADILIRADAHAAYPDHYASRLVKTLNETGADSVVVPLIAASTEGAWQIAGARLQTCWLGNGGAAHRRRTRSGWVRHGHHAAFRLDRFLEIGGYDTAFVANEDVEFDKRLLKAGGSIWLENGLAVSYRPRSNATDLLRQMFRNGKGRWQTAEKHGESLGLRQLLPVAALTGTAMSLAAALTYDIRAGGLALAYLLTVLLLAGIAGRGDAILSLRVSWLAILSHFGFGAGVLTRAMSPVPKVQRPMPRRLRPA